ncbi:hypothetical protein DUNSADRAFT_10514 [Dunaliella salina]|uniref:Encoded protein n=1 Tax=Dunaliella salina TaxID=3046 RepID=A0ABQ7GF50_DUNSA|nr:hypothetical protein DUNSADRAFT_10514 [Dunaliella salina]|eukprot:KAF5833232.1 hypothetical protein DUNSADRAFT_10514 [Dunaliella salina]
MKKLFEQVNSNRTLLQSRWSTGWREQQSGANEQRGAQSNAQAKGPTRDSEDGSACNSSELSLLRQQLVDAKVKNGMLLSELEEVRVHASTAGQLRGKVEDYKVSHSSISVTSYFFNLYGCKAGLL